MGIKYNQTATYWAPLSINEYAEQSFDPPITIKVRWERNKGLHQEVQNNIRISEETVARGMVYTDTLLSLRGYLFLGVTASINPLDVEDAYRIMRVFVTPSVKANKEVIKAWL